MEESRLYPENGVETRLTKVLLENLNRRRKYSSFGGDNSIKIRI